MEAENDFSLYEEMSRAVRLKILEIIYKTKSPHIGPSFSIVEILVALYFKFLNHSPDDPCNSHRDRFLLSKGHASPAFYAVLAERGFLDKKELEEFAVNGCSLAHHPDKDVSRGIEISSGSLGHGLSIGVGIALAGNFDDIPYKAYVLLGDGELNEGSVWEAVMFAGHHKLHNLVALVDYNRMQALGHTKDIIELDPMGDKWKAFGWHVQEMDGHCYESIFRALSSLSLDKPNVLVLNTVKGKGVSFMEDRLLWHYRTPDPEEYELALEELSQ
jgi:transketolase